MSDEKCAQIKALLDGGKLDEANALAYDGVTTEGSSLVAEIFAALAASRDR